MAAPTNVRVRLAFDYPPPAIPESCMFLLLVDVKRCRVVTDLGSIIRERFFYGQRGGLSLYVDDCLLPPGESIQVIRDNDSIRVKWDEVYPEDEFETNNILSPPKKSKKRHRKKSSEETEDSEIKPKKQKTDYSEECLNSSSDHIVNKRRKNKKKRKKERCLLDSCVENEIHRKSIKGMLDEEDETKKSKKLTISEEQPAGKCSRKSLTLGASDPVSSKRKESSSSSLDSSEEDDVNKVKKKNVAADGLCSPNVVKKVQDEDVNKELEVGIHKEQNSFKQSKKAYYYKCKGNQAASDGVQGPSLDPIVWGRGVGRGRGRGDNSPWRGRGFRGRGDGKNPGRRRGENPLLSYNTEIQKEQQLNESATNKSVIIENPPVIPEKDYSTLPLLAAPPQVGKLIAFKLLELTENYTPEVSDYKEGKILSFDPFTKQLDVEIYSNESVLKEPGKFDLVYEMAGGRNIVEYAVQQDRRITQRWDSLIEPRLILDSVPQEALSTPQTVNAGL
ncbi:LOW QUALITY PROTEIN: coilin [Bombina bombina]|uniref:LOW QUALITY PROTEIN: coilin n=1 Tax=Bombina bombina TaxID=8345 RepID=UPI00235A8EB6|nr:LOW QUALITY PROTEIN: coilin [Bombina bombina]